jgi:beta-xylosidase
MERVKVNPIIPGFAPDPSVIYVDGTYFLVNSSFHMFPGLPIYASRDLKEWKHIGMPFLPLYLCHDQCQTYLSNQAMH